MTTSPPANPVATSPLFGLRALLVEDNALVAGELKRILSREGCEIVQHCDTLDDALQAANAEAVYSIALLDINLRGEMVFPAATRLVNRGVPILLLTGYGADFIPDAFQWCEILEKPFTPALLQKAMLNALRRPAPHTPPASAPPTSLGGVTPVTWPETQ